MCAGFFWRRPRPNILLCATDKSYLEELLTRLRAPDKKRALPSELPEWKQVETAAPCWAVRHFARDRSAWTDPSSPIGGGAVFDDSQAIGMTFWLDPAHQQLAEVRYVSQNPKALEIMKGGWDHLEGVTVKVTQRKPGVIAIKADLDKDTFGNFSTFVLGFLGHIPWGV